MLNPQEALSKTNKYLKKLKFIIEKQAIFTFAKTKIIDKSIIDDILCCIEASLPDEYRDFTKRKNGRNLKSYAMLINLHAVIKGRFILSSSCYSVKYSEALTLIEGLPKALNFDINSINNSSSDMF